MASKKLRNAAGLDGKGNRSVKPPSRRARGPGKQGRPLGFSERSRGERPRRKNDRRDRLILIAIIIIAGLFILRRTVRLAQMGRVTLSRATAAGVAPPNEQLSPWDDVRSSG